jgi:hypothetical protein
MKTQILKFQWLLILVAGLFITSCSDSTDTGDDASAEAYAEEVVTRTLEGANLGKAGCYELVFPVTLSFPDATTAEIASVEALKEALKTWRKENPRVRTRPSLAFPYSVINDGGEVILVENETQQRELRVACGKEFGGHDRDKHKSCFKINFPFSVMLPDSTVITLNAKEDRKVLHDAIKAFKAANPGVKVKPEVVFPISVTMEDGTVVTVNTKEELKALKESCK